jgi:hypothetical protein
MTTAPTGKPHPGQYWWSGSHPVPHWGHGLKEGAAVICSKRSNAPPLVKDYPPRPTRCAPPRSAPKPSPRAAPIAPGLTWGANGPHADAAVNAPRLTPHTSREVLVCRAHPARCQTTHRGAARHTSRAGQVGALSPSANHCAGSSAAAKARHNRYTLSTTASHAGARHNRYTLSTTASDAGGSPRPSERLQNQYASPWTHKKIRGDEPELVASKPTNGAIRAR